MVILPSLADEPCCSIEHRLESVQEARRRTGKQAVAAVHPRSDKSGNSHLRSPQRQRLDAAPDKMELARAAMVFIWTFHDSAALSISTLRNYIEWTLDI